MPAFAVDAAATVADCALPVDRRAALGLFLRHLAAGERVARDAARGQAGIAPAGRDRRFLRAQVRQEALHAALFDGCARSLGATPFEPDPQPYRDYSASIAVLVAGRRYDESVVATQLVLEALGDAMLARLDAGLARHGDRLRELRRTIRRQETAHHRHGLALIAAWDDDTIPERLRACALRHRALAVAMIAGGERAMRPFALAPADLEADLDARLPRWARGDA